MNWFQRLFAGKTVAPDEVVNEAVDSARAALSTDLVSAYVYGSLATGEYIEGHSNINVLFVTRRLDAEILKKLAPTVQKWSRHPHLKSFFLSVVELKAYSESFPMEFGDISEFRKLIGGEDVFQKIEISNARLAQELESEIKISLAKLRKKYLLSGGDDAAARDQIVETSKSLFPILRAFLRLKKRKPPKQRVRLIEEACRSFRFGRRTLLQVHDLRYGRRNAERIEIEPLYAKLIQELAMMADEAGRGIREMPAASGEERAPRRDRDRDRDRDRRDRDNGPMRGAGGGDRTAKIGQVRQLIQEASQRKKWEPKDPERFQSDEFSRDASLTLSARFGWDKAWQPERRAKGYVPVQVEPAVVEEPSYEEEFGENESAQADEAVVPEHVEAPREAESEQSEDSEEAMVSPTSQE